MKRREAIATGIPWSHAFALFGIGVLLLPFALVKKLADL